MAIRPRRSVLYMPGSNARAIEKARTLPADAVILDLEDSVAPDGKAAARKQVANAVTAGGFGAREVDHSHQWPRYRMVARRSQRRGQGEAGRGAGAEGVDPRPPGRRGRTSGRHQRRPEDPHLGDDGNAARHAQRRRDRSRGEGRRDQARGFRDGHQRSRQGHARENHPRTRPDGALADGLRDGRARAWHRHPRRRLQ